MLNHRFETNEQLGCICGKVFVIIKLFYFDSNFTLFVEATEQFEQRKYDQIYLVLQIRTSSECINVMVIGKFMWYLNV